MSEHQTLARVRFEKVEKRFGAQVALRDIDLDIEPGECLVLLGPSGCGKTTLLRLLAGLETVDGGRIYIGDRVVNDTLPAARDVAMVFQSYALYPHMSVHENIAFPLRVRRMAPGDVDHRVRDVAERLGLSALLARRPSQLSGGQQQRVALARAMVRSPLVYLMDEPLSNLDAQLRLQMRTELKRIQQELKTTTLYVTHDQAEAMTMGSRVVLLRQGKIEQVGTPLDLYERPASRFVGTFLGSPSMNIWPAAWDSSGVVRSMGIEISVAPERRAVMQSAGEIEVGVRPEDVKLSASAPDGGSASGEGRVLVIEPMGNETIVTLEREGVRVVARAPAQFQPAPGSTVWFSVEAGRVSFFRVDSGARVG